MKFVRFNHNKLGVLTKDETEILEISRVLKKSNFKSSVDLNSFSNFHIPRTESKFKSMLDLIENITEDDLTLLHESISGERRGLRDDIIYKIVPREPNDNSPEYIYHKISDVTINSPIKKPIHDIICVGLNYRDHLEETKKSFQGNLDEPTKIVYFSKRAYEIIGPGDAIKSRMDLDTQLDYEVELAVIIGKKGSNIAVEDVEDYIFGYSVFNDISSRTLQKSHVQWYRGKSLDTYSSMGPCILHKDSLPFPIEIDLKSYINGELRQSSNTRLFLADIPRIISEISTGITLEPGDIIVTGTPSGVGMGMKPECYMKKGDTVTCEIEKIGKLENIIE